MRACYGPCTGCPDTNHPVSPLVAPTGPREIPKRMRRHPPHPPNPPHPLSYRLLAFCLALLLPMQTATPMAGECHLHGAQSPTMSATADAAHAGHAMEGAMLESTGAPSDQPDCDHMPAASTCAPCTVPALTTVVDVGAEPEHHVRPTRLVFDVPASVDLIPDGPPPRA